MNTEKLSKFINRIRQASRAQNKQLVLPLQDAEDIIDELALLLLESSDLKNKIIELQNEQTNITVAIDGGKF